jgi:hypothetical protein
MGGVDDSALCVAGNLGKPQRKIIGRRGSNDGGPPDSECAASGETLNRVQFRWFREHCRAKMADAGCTPFH